LKDGAKAGVYHLSADARELAGAAASAGLMVIYRSTSTTAHDRKIHAEARNALRFPEAGWARKLGELSRSA